MHLEGTIKGGTSNAHLLFEPLESCTDGRTNCQSPAPQAGKVGTDADSPPADNRHGQALLEGLGVGACNGARPAEALHPQSILTSNDI